MENTERTQKPSWQQMLVNAVTQPGKIHEAYRRFWNYSSGNQVLALSQCVERGVEPGPMASFRRWRDLGRRVKKGERAIALIMPITVRSHPNRSSDDQESEDNGEGDTRSVFVLKRNWFVLSQTVGAPYEPEPIPGWDVHVALDTLGIQEEQFRDLNGNVQGYARDRVIAVSPLAALAHKSRFHEIGHVLLGHTTKGGLSDTESIPKSLIEAEAESVALICCESLDLPGAEFSRGYIQGWLEGEAIPERSAQRIFAAANKILKAGIREQSSGGER